MRIIAITSPKVIEDDVFLIQRLLETGIDTIHLRTESVNFGGVTMIGSIYHRNALCKLNHGALI